MKQKTSSTMINAQVLMRLHKLRVVIWSDQLERRHVLNLLAQSDYSVVKPRSRLIKEEEEEAEEDVDTWCRSNNMPSLLDSPAPRT